MSKEIQELKKEITKTTILLRELKTKLKLLQHTQSSDIGIKWVVEIKECLNLLQPLTISDIIKNITKKYKTTEDRNIRNKVATTLSRLHKDGTINKIEERGTPLYGYPEAFSKK